MANDITTPGYRSGSILLHWLMLLLLAAVYATIELRGLFPKGSSAHDLMKTSHFMLGLSVLLLVWLRLALRWSGQTPPIEPPPPRWQERLAALVQILLYLIMVALPIAGWLLLSAKGRPIPFFGLELPALINENETLADTIKEVHETIATSGYFLIALHASAALYHHYWLADNTLTRMMPPRSSH